MDSPLIPIGLFAALVASMVAAIPLSAAGSGALAAVALWLFLVALGGLAWWVIRTDRGADPEIQLTRAADHFDARWDGFERDFWDYVAAGRTEPR